MKISDFDYDLPESLIAKQPPKTRGASRLLVLNRRTGEVDDRKYADIVDYLRPGDVLVLNNTRVIKARLMTTKPNGAQREILILESHGVGDDWHHHQVMYRGRLSTGDQLFIARSDLAIMIEVEEILDGGLAIVRSATDLLELAEKYGSPPLPPYLKRHATATDVKRYQTVFARQAGSVAAPTASLNMTDELIQKIADRGVKVAYITLHVGLGTFLPIRADDVENHQIHSEYFEIPAETVATIQSTKAENRRVIAVGTTVARTLEYSASSLRELSPVIARLQPKQSTPKSSGEADIYIYPGYKFQIVDALLTNFHAPRSTVLMLAAAFAGPENLRVAYNHAKTHDYQFLSYGDSMLIV
jgi:S-adenosylmethionine:tRNA ribosyltransferase-isomerase